MSCRCGCGQEAGPFSQGWVNGHTSNTNPMHCVNGHSRLPENTGSGGKCKVCATAAQRAKRAALRAEKETTPKARNTSRAWMDDAACDGMETDWWFPKQGPFPQDAKARDICRRCPVQKKCLEYALLNREEFGIWGGLAELKRRKLRKLLRAGKPMDYVLTVGVEMARKREEREDIEESEVA